jgi:hypothetical protein
LTRIAAAPSAKKTIRLEDAEDRSALQVGVPESSFTAVRTAPSRGAAMTAVLFVADDRAFVPSSRLVEQTCPAPRSTAVTCGRFLKLLPRGGAPGDAAL